jgi:aspartate-semialdehyde dehydrogenase
VKQRVGIVGFRGMVGSVLLDRMKAEGDFDLIEPTFFSTSRAGDRAPLGDAPVADAYDLAALSKLDVLISCQGGDYTTRVHPELRRAGFAGYFIDAASTLRMSDSATIILDPVNRPVIDSALAAGCKDFIGGNCTVSLMLMAVHGLYQRGLVEWVSSMTYQAASGAGAKNMRELLQQLAFVTGRLGGRIDDEAEGALELDRAASAALGDGALPRAEFGEALALNLLPWIDKPVEGGATREEWKGHAESNKILGNDPAIPVDGVCVRVGAMRCHSQGLTIKLTKDVPTDEIEDMLRQQNAWTRVVPNERAATLAGLTPKAVSGTLDVAIGRLKKLRMGPTYLGAFTVGDQLLWGAAEPLRRMLRILI